MFPRAGLTGVLIFSLKGRGGRTVCRHWLGGITVRCWTDDQKVVTLTIGRVAIIAVKRLQWVTVCRQVNRLGILPTTKVNSAVHPC